MSFSEAQPADWTLAKGPAPAAQAASHARSDPFWVRALLIGTALLFAGLFLVLPLATVFIEAFRKGALVYLDAIREPAALAAIRLTLLVAAISVPVNAVFGAAAAWAITKFDFRGKSLLVTAIDLPFARERAHALQALQAAELGSGEPLVGLVCSGAEIVGRRLRGQPVPVARRALRLPARLEQVGSQRTRGDLLAEPALAALLSHLRQRALQRLLGPIQVARLDGFIACLV